MRPRKLFSPTRRGSSSSHHSILALLDCSALPGSSSCTTTTTSIMPVTKGVILVGGPSKGTRMRPLSLDCELPMRTHVAKLKLLIV